MHLIGVVSNDGILIELPPSAVGRYVLNHPNYPNQPVQLPFPGLQLMSMMMDSPSVEQVYDRFIISNFVDNEIQLQMVADLIPLMTARVYDDTVHERLLVLLAQYRKTKPEIIIEASIAGLFNYPDRGRSLTIDNLISLTNDKRATDRDIELMIQRPGMLESILAINNPLILTKLLIVLIKQNRLDEVNQIATQLSSLVDIDLLLTILRTSNQQLLVRLNIHRIIELIVLVNNRNKMTELISLVNHDRLLINRMTTLDKRLILIFSIMAMSSGVDRIIDTLLTVFTTNSYVVQLIRNYDIDTLSLLVVLDYTHIDIIVNRWSIGLVVELFKITNDLRIILSAYQHNLTDLVNCLIDSMTVMPTDEQFWTLFDQHSILVRRFIEEGYIPRLVNTKVTIGEVRILMGYGLFIGPQFWSSIESNREAMKINRDVLNYLIEMSSPDSIHTLRLLDLD